MIVTESMALILSALQTGESNAVNAKTLCRLCNIDDRTVRAIIEKLRRSGKVICSGNQGYYYPGTASELERYIRRMNSRIRSGRACIKPAEIMLEKWREGGYNG